MNDDLTRRLRLSSKPDSVDRERYMAGTLFGDWMRDHEEVMSIDAITRGAQRSIEASCIFWEQWDIATLTPDVKVEDEGLPCPEAIEET